MRKKGVVFDFDGTLIDSTTEGVERCCRIAHLQGLDVNDEIKKKIKSLWGKTGLDLIQACWPGMDAEHFIDTWEYYDAKHPLPLFPHTREALDLLVSKHNVTLSILTSRRHSTHAQLNFHGLHSLFTFIYTLGDCPLPKPHPSSIASLIKDYERHGTTKDHLVIVGDSIYSDYPLALQVKIDFIGVTWGHSAKEDFIRAGLKEKYILDSMTELLPLIEQWQDS